MRPLIVGQAPSRGREGEPPLSGRSGVRLAGLAGTPLEEFLRRTDRVNLIERWPGRSGKGDRFPIREAAARATIIFPALSDRVVVLLGTKVALAFRLGPPDPFVWNSLPAHHRVAWSFCPHPSGLNLWWNDPANVERARAFWTNLLRC